MKIKLKTENVCIGTEIDFKVTFWLIWLINQRALNNHALFVV